MAKENRVGRFIKNSSDIRTYTIDWSEFEEMESESISSCTVSSSPSGLSHVGTATISGKETSVGISNGTNLVEYDVAFTMTTSGGSVIKRCIQIFVQDC